MRGRSRQWTRNEVRVAIDGVRFIAIERNPAMHLGAFE